MSAITLMGLAASASTSPETEGGVAAIDPTTLALLSIFGGAALTVIAGFIGAGIQARREHRQWLRNQRLAAYTAFLRSVHDMREATNELERTRAMERRASATAKELRDLIAAEDERIAHGAEDESDIAAKLATATERLTSQQEALMTARERLEERFRLVISQANEGAAPFAILGPREVSRAARVIPDAMERGPEAVRAALPAVTAAMRDALRIKDKKRPRGRKSRRSAR